MACLDVSAPFGPLATQPACAILLVILLTRAFPFVPRRERLHKVAMRFASFAAVSFMTAISWASPVLAQTTPIDQPLPEGMVTSITCELTQPPKYTEVPVFQTAKEAEATKGIYHYKLWLPIGYAADHNKRWPCVFIMNSGGNAEMGKMQTYLQSHGYIVIMLVEAKNGRWEPIIGNFLAAHDDAIKRLRIQENRKYATGLSGGARASSLFVQLRSGFCGLLLQGAGLSFDPARNLNVAGIKQNASLYVAMTIGKADPRTTEADRLKTMIPPDRFAVFGFDGGHEWAPAEVFEKAMEWINSKVEKSSIGSAVSSGSSEDYFKKK